MQEFSSISVSSYEAGSLAEQLTEQSRSGWSVVAIVPTGSTITAYLARDTDGEPAPAAAAPAVEPAPEPAPEPTPEPATSGWGAADTEPALAAIVPDATPEPASEPSPEPATADVAPEPAATEIMPSAASSDTASSDTAATGAASASAAGAAPAGWYADPSGRFELRYWDGGQWTEHVSRAGQQYTDPPVA